MILERTGMTEIEFPPLVDGHVHLGSIDGIDGLAHCLEATHALRAGIACQLEGLTTNTNPAGIVMKARQPDRK